MKTYSREWKCSAKRLRFARAWKNSCVCDENLLAGMKMFRETLTFRKTSRKILDIYVSAALLRIGGYRIIFDFCYLEAIVRSEEEMVWRRESRQILSSVRSRQALDIPQLSTNSFSVIAAAHRPVESCPSLQANSFHRK